MKSTLVAMSVFLSVTVWANTVESVFKKDSPVSIDLKQLILESVLENCSDVVSAYGLQETGTSVNVVRIDQGQKDYFYTTTFLSRYFFDGMHPISQYITVKSAEYGFQNGSNLEIISVNCQ